MIRSIIERTGVKIDVEDDGRVNVAPPDGESARKAIPIHPGADRHARAEQDVPLKSSAHHRVRRFRGDHASRRARAWLISFFDSNATRVRYPARRPERSQAEAFEVLSVRREIARTL